MEDQSLRQSLLQQTFRQQLQDKGINVDDLNSVLVNYEAQKEDVKLLILKLLPLRINELEQCLQQSNSNLLNLKESLEYVLLRESQSQQENAQLQAQIEDQAKRFQTQIDELKSLVQKKDYIINEMQEKLAQKQEMVQNITLKCQE